MYRNFTTITSPFRRLESKKMHFSKTAFELTQNFHVHQEKKAFESYQTPDLGFIRKNFYYLQKLVHLNCTSHYIKQGTIGCQGS